MDGEPPPFGMLDMHLALQTLLGGARFSKPNNRDAKRHHEKPNRDHKNGVIIPMNINRTAQKIEVNLVLDMGHFFKHFGVSLARVKCKETTVHSAGSLCPKA